MRLLLKASIASQQLREKKGIKMKEHLCFQVSTCNMKTAILAATFFLWLQISETLHMKFNPPEGAFFVKFESRTIDKNFLNARQNLSSNLHPFLIHGCPRPEHNLEAEESGFSTSVPLHSLMPNGNKKHRVFSNSINISYSCGFTVRLIETVISKDLPSINVLVHVNSGFWKQMYGSSSGSPSVVVYAEYKNQQINRSCKVNFASSAYTCLIQLNLPLKWWPLTFAAKKSPKTFVDLSYAVLLHRENTDDTLTEEQFALGKVLLAPRKAYTVAPIDGVLNLLMPNVEFYKGMLFSVPVYFHFDSSMMKTPLHLFQVRCIVKNELRLLNVESAKESGWEIQSELNYIHSAATVTAFHRDHASLNETWSGVVFTLVFQIVEYPKPISLGANPELKLSRAELTWTVRYVIDAMSSQNSNAVSDRRQQRNPTTTVSYSGRLHNVNLGNETTDTNTENKSSANPDPTDLPNYVPTDFPNKEQRQRFERREESSESFEMTNLPHEPVYLNAGKIISYLTVRKDAVMTIVPVATRFDLVNTAVLTGHQVSDTLKIYSVTYAGQISDVTLQSSCLALHTSVLKVTPSCTAVYLDGSETRGEVNASILVEFGNHQTIASFTVWYPVFPVQISVSDPVLHAIKEWKLAVPQKRKSRGITRHIRKRRKRAKDGHQQCRLRFQEAEIKVYAKFKIQNLRTGHSSFLGGHGSKLLLDITDLSSQHLRIASEPIAKIYRSPADKMIVQGLSEGKTEVQLILPLAKYAVGSTKIEVTNEKVSLRHLRAVAIAGLNLTLDPIDSVRHSSGLIQYQVLARVQIGKIFSQKYQKGSLSLSIQYSDGMISDLQNIEAEHFQVRASSRDDEEIVFVSLPNDQQRLDSLDLGPVPNFLMIFDRNGGVSIQIDLMFPDSCSGGNGEMKTLHTRAFAETSYIQDSQKKLIQNRALSSPPETQQRKQREEGVVNAGFIEKAQTNEMDSLMDTVKQLKEAPNPTTTKFHSSGEVILFVLLAVVGLAGSVFAVNCLLYGPQNSRYKFHRLVPGFIRLPRSSSESATPCQEWVWLSRDQLEGGGNGAPRRKRYAAMGNNSHVSLLAGCYCGGGGSINSPPDEEDPDFGEYQSNQEAQSVLRSSLGSRGSQESAAARLSTHNRISYQGSEVSIHISKQPIMEVHPYGAYYTGPPGHSRRVSSWNQTRSLGSRMRITSNPIIDSSSEQNLSTVHPLSSLAGSETKSEGELDWDSRSLGLNETELRDYFSSLRETTA